MLHIFLFYIIGQEQRSHIMDENFRFIRNYHLDFKFHDDPVACQTYPFTGWNGPMLKFSLSLIHNASLMAFNFSAYKLLKCLGILISKLHCRNRSFRVIFKISTQYIMLDITSWKSNFFQCAHIIDRRTRSTKKNIQWPLDVKIFPKNQLESSHPSFLKL